MQDQYDKLRMRKIAATNLNSTLTATANGIP